MILIFNNVSLHKDDESVDTIRENITNAFKDNTELKSQEKRIFQYLYDLKEIAKKFYLKEDVSD